MDDIRPFRGRPDVFDQAEQTGAVEVVVCHVERGRAIGVDVVGCLDERVVDGADVVRGGRVQDMVEELDLRACGGNGAVGGVGFGCELRVGQVVDGEDVDGGWVLRVGDDVDAVRDEKAVEVLQCQTGGFEGLAVMNGAC